MIIDKAKLKALVEQGSLPPIISVLIAEIERLEGSVQSLIQMERNTGNRALEYAGKCDQLRAEVAGLKTGYEAYERVNAELKAEVERLRKYGEEFAVLAERRREQVEALRNALMECADSLQGEMLQKFGGRLPEDMHPVTRREYDRDVAEVSGYRAALGQGEQS